MPFSIADLTKKEETAEKIPTKNPPLSLARIFCFPFVVWRATSNNKKTMAEITKAREEASEAADAESWEDAMKRQRNAERYEARESRPKQPPQEKKVPDVESMDPRLEMNPENPRVCDPNCECYGKEYCPAHMRERPEHPTSPGLLAI